MLLTNEPLTAVRQTTAVTAVPLTAAAARPNTPATQGTAPVASLIRTGHNQLHWVDGLGITCLITLGGTVAIGWLDAMLPSGLAIAAIAIRTALVASLATRTRTRNAKRCACLTWTR